MIDIESEHLLSPDQALKHPALRNGKGRVPHLSLFYRLVNKGARAKDGSRITLEAIKCPSGYRTSAEAISRMVLRLTTGGGSTQVTPKALKRQRRLADEALDAAGIR